MKFREDVRGDALIPRAQKENLLENLDYVSLRNDINSGTCARERIASARDQGIITVDQYNELVEYGYDLYRHTSNEDPLTGISNRRGLFSRGNQIFEEINLDSSASKKEQRTDTFKSALVILFDLDKFKPINDKYGHPAGDSALRLIADKLRSMTRSQDIISRIGGDEYVIVCPFMDIVTPDGVNIAEAVYNRYVTYLFDDLVVNINGEDVKLEGTMGHSVIVNGNYQTFEQALKVADEEAKNNKIIKGSGR